MSPGGRVAFVTGASRGLGEALALQLAEAGWDVFAIARRAPRLAHPRVRPLGVDLADLDASRDLVGAAMDAAAQARPSRALLVNNAATAGPVGRLGTLDAGELREALDVNLVAPALLANRFCAAFRPAGGSGEARRPAGGEEDARRHASGGRADAHEACECRVINVSSGLAARAIAAEGAYSVAKCGLEMLTRALAADHPDARFAAVSFRPGIIDTDMQAFLRGQGAERLPDVAMFRDFHASGALVAPSRVAEVAIAALVEGPVRSGETYDFRTLAS